MSLNKFVKDHTTLKTIIDTHKRNGKKIVFTNGCFDLLHVGHIRYLEGAKQLGDILLVAINSDASVEKIKGTGPPIMNEQERVEILCALECVDYVTLFEGTSPAELILLLEPHIQAKGTDYTVETVPERDVVLSYGGAIAITGDPKNRSSTLFKELLEKLHNQNT